MARFIPVEGTMLSEETFSTVMEDRLGIRMGPVSIIRLPSDNIVISYLDDTRVNRLATELAGQTVYGDAIFFRDQERYG